MVDSGFVEYIVDLLSIHGNIRSRKMFSGYGIYLDSTIFAIIIDDELYFKADSDLAKRYELAGSFPFTYKRGEKTIALSYWYVPSEVIENEDSLKDWFNKSLSVARLKKSKKQ